MSTHQLNRNTFGDPKNSGNLMPLDEAHQLLNEWVTNERLRLHMKQVAAVMKAWAILKEGADEKRNIDPEVIHCIASHGPRYFGVEPNNKMDKMIYAFDELSGFVHASALIRPTRYDGMDVKSVMKKLKTPSFAAQVNRDDITDAIARIEYPLEDIIQFVIDHQKNVKATGHS
jgi:predicted hydrolase (HD superfamily)